MILITKKLRKEFTSGENNLVILDDISFNLEEGKALAITGPSGSGKSTLLSLLAGLDTATSGLVKLMDSEISGMDEEARAVLRGQHVGFVFQSFQLLTSLTALENVMLPVELRGDALAQDQAVELLEKVGLADRLDHYPRQLSGGEQQRVAIARAFASRPTILFADEPTGNLDTANGEKIIDLLFDLNSEFGTTIVLVTHESRLADRCSRTIKLTAGKVDR